MRTAHVVRALLLKTADSVGLPTMAASIGSALTAPEGEEIGYGVRTAIGAGTLGSIGMHAGNTLGGAKGNIIGGLGGTAIGALLGRLWANSSHDRDVERHVGEYAQRQQEEMMRQQEKTSAAPGWKLRGWVPPAGAALAAGGLAYGMSGKDQNGEDHSVRNALMAAAPAALAGHGLNVARRPLAQSAAGFAQAKKLFSPETQGKINTWANGVNPPAAQASATQPAAQVPQVPPAAHTPQELKDMGNAYASGGRGA